MTALLFSARMPFDQAQAQTPDSNRHRMSAAAKFAAAIALTVGLFGQQAEAAQTYVIKSDRGGFLLERLAELDTLQQNGTHVEIRGRVCYSTCTMFLGLPNICVDPNTTFGFHGPSRSGRKLAKKDFDYFSSLMASYYPKPLKDWFMSTARNRITGVHKVKGRELIRMGVPECKNAT